MRKQFLLILILVGFITLATGGIAQETAGVKVTITEPAKDIATIASQIQVKGVATAVEEGVEVSMVLVDVNGVPQKVSVKEDGSFEATVDLATGANIIAAIAIGSDGTIASNRRFVTREQEILFYDDFEGKELKQEWEAPPAYGGQWVLENGALTTANAREGLPMHAFVGDGWWKDYIVDVDVIYENCDHASCPWGRENQVAFFIRVQDEHNMMGFFLQPGGKSGFRIRKEGIWGDFAVETDTTRFTNAHITIVVKEHTYTALLNDQVLASFKNEEEGFPKGYVGLQFAVSYGHLVYFDNFKVTSITPKGATPLSLGQLPSGISTTVWQQGVEKQLSWLGPLTNTLQASLGTTQRKIGQVETQVNTLKDGWQPLKAQVAQLASNREQMQGQLDKFEIRLSSQRHKLEALEGNIKGARSMAMLGLIAGMIGIALAGLVVLGVVG